jgi:hypothetical protein
MGRMCERREAREDAEGGPEQIPRVNVAHRLSTPAQRPFRAVVMCSKVDRSWSFHVRATVAICYDCVDSDPLQTMSTVQLDAL